MRLYLKINQKVLHWMRGFLTIFVLAEEAKVEFFAMEAMKELAVCQKKLLLKKQNSTIFACVKLAKISLFAMEPTASIQMRILRKILNHNSFSNLKLDIFWNQTLDFLIYFNKVCGVNSVLGYRSYEVCISIPSWNYVHMNMFSYACPARFS